MSAGLRIREQRLALSGREEQVDNSRRTIAASVRDAHGYFVEDPVLDVESSPKSVPAG